MTKNDLKQFVDNWLSAWTGNKPEHLLTFYTKNTFYLDPANPDGIKGKEELKKYLNKLLKKNPDWKWTAEEIFPTEKGFTIKWKAEIPLSNKTFTIYGLDIVEIADNKISRNEVYFDRYNWLKELTQINFIK